MIIIGLSEGGEEIYQDLILRHARGEEWEWDAISKEVFAIGFVMGAGMGLAGTILAVAAGSLMGNMIGNALMGNKNFANRSSSVNKSAYSRSAAGKAARSGKSSRKSFFGGSSSRSSYGSRTFGG